MRFAIETWFAVNRFTPGRRAHSATRIKAASRGRYATVDGLCDAIVRKEREQIALQGRFKAGQAQQDKGEWTPEIVALDLELDRLIGELRDVLASLGKRKGPRGEAAQRILERHFAQGVGYYTQQIFEDESARVDVLLSELEAGQPEVASASVEDYVADVKRSHTRYAELIASHGKPERVSWDDVKALDLANQRTFLELVALVFAETRELAESEREATRKELLQVVADHDAELSAQIAARLRVKDVDPDSGKPEPSDND